MRMMVVIKIGNFRSFVGKTDVVAISNSYSPSGMSVYLCIVPKSLLKIEFAVMEKTAYFASGPSTNRPDHDRK